MLLSMSFPELFYPGPNHRASADNFQSIGFHLNRVIAAGGPWLISDIAGEDVLFRDSRCAAIPLDV